MGVSVIFINIVWLIALQMNMYFLQVNNVNLHSLVENSFRCCYGCSSGKITFNEIYEIANASYLAKQKTEEEQH